MPTINTWISDDDYNKYLVVKQKGKGSWTKFIHNSLNGEPINNVLNKMVDLGVAIEKHTAQPVKIPRVIKTKEDVHIFSQVKDYGGKLCKHGSPKGSCMHKEATSLKCNV